MNIRIPDFLLYELLLSMLSIIAATTGNKLSLNIGMS